MRATVLLVLLAAPALACASGTERFREFVRGTQSLRADFEQKVYDRERRLTQEARGTFSFLRPGRFRWATVQPYEQLVVGDGERVWVYDPDLKQVTVRSMGQALGATPAALLAGSAEAERAFQLSDVGRIAGLDWMEARPRDKDAGFERMRLGFGPAGVEAMEMVDPFGQTTLLRFSNVARNPPLDPAAFRFVPPKGVDVLGE